MNCRLPMKIGTPGGGGVSYPDGAFIPVTKFTDGKTYALVAKINGTYRYINTTTYNNYTMNATVVEVTEKSGYVLFGSDPATFVAKASGDGFTLGNDTNYLHGTTSNGTALRYGTTSAVWKVDTSETGGFASGKYLPKEVSSSVWLKNTSGSYDWCIKFESAGSFGYDRAGRDNTYSTGFVSFVLYEKWDGQTGGDSGGDSGGGDDGLDYHDNFADNDWATIAKVCAEGLVPTTWKVGDQKAMTISGTSYPIDIIGIQHDDYSDGSGKAPFTFQFHDCHKTKAALSSDGNNTYTSTKMKTTTLPGILNQMPSEVKAAIKEVTKTTCHGNTLTTIVTTEEKLFLLSEIEVTGSRSYSGNGEGSKYAYYSSSTQRRKNLNGSTSEWWTRSPVSSSGSRNVAISTAGSASSQTVTSTYGVAPAFCFGAGGSGGGGGGSTPTVKEYAVNITGTGDSSYCHVTVNGTKYTSAKTVSVTEGTKISCYVKTQTGTAGNVWVGVNLNGSWVLETTGTYTHTVNANCTVDLRHSTPTDHIYITTE